MNFLRLDYLPHGPWFPRTFSSVEKIFFRTEKIGDENKTLSRSTRMAKSHVLDEAGLPAHGDFAKK
jgi:hypothetical protein